MMKSYDKHRLSYKDPLFLVILFTSFTLGVLYLVLYFVWDKERLVGEILWYIPMMNSFAGLAAFIVAFLAFRRYHVFRDPASYWIGLGFISFSVLTIFFIMTCPNVLPGGKSLINALPNTSTWITWFELFDLIPALFAAVFLRWPDKKTFIRWNWLWSVVLCILVVTLVAVFSIKYESSLPPLVKLQGNMTVLLLVFTVVCLFLFIFGAVFSTLRYLLTGDSFLGYLGLANTAFIFLIVTILIEEKTFDIWYYLNRILILSGFLIMMFGLLSDYIRLFQSEQKKSQQLSFALKARDEFISIASHELRTPITTLKLQVHIAQLEIRKKDPRLRNLEHLEKFTNQLDKQINHLTRLVEDMLDVVRAQLGKIRLNIEEIELCSLVKDVIDRIAPQMIELGTVPQLYCHNAVKGRWDPYRIEQVIVNLLTNAMKYGDKKPVSIQVESNGTNALLYVTDQGRGIAKEDRDRIFSRFERAVSKDEVTGLGVGLYISEQIIKLHHGRIWVESELGKGSTFYIELPISDDLEKEHA